MMAGELAPPVSGGVEEDDHQERQMHGGNPSQALGQILDDWLLGRFARGEIMESTFGQHQVGIRSFVAFVGADTPVTDVTTERIEAWLGQLRTPAGRPLKLQSRNTKSAPIRAFFRWAAERRLIEQNPMAPIRRARVPRGPLRRVPPEQVAAVLAAPEVGFREKVMIVVMVQCMLRRVELSRLRVEDWDPTAGTLQVHGKGDKHRVVRVPDEAAEWLARWLADGRRSGPMWPSSQRFGESMTPGSIGEAVKAAAAKVGLEITSHQYRHTGAADAVSRGGEGVLAAVQAQLGHESLATTSVYVRATGAEIGRAVEGRRYG